MSKRQPPWSGVSFRRIRCFTWCIVCVTFEPFGFLQSILTKGSPPVELFLALSVRRSFSQIQPRPRDSMPSAREHRMRVRCIDDTLHVLLLRSYGEQLDKRTRMWAKLPPIPSNGIGDRENVCLPRPIWMASSFQPRRIPVLGGDHASLLRLESGRPLDRNNHRE